MIFNQIDNLRNFVLVCEKGSFTKAAEETFISRQALSKSVSMLEKELGIFLFVRSKRGVYLTEYGKFVYKEVLPILTQIDRFQRELARKINTSAEKIIRVNIFPSSIYLLPNGAIERFASTFLDEKYKLEVSNHATIPAREKLIAGELDIIIEAGSQAGKGLNTYFVKGFQRTCLVPRGNPLSKKDVISIDDLQHEHMVLCMNKLDYEYFVSLCQQKQLDPDIRFTSETNVMYELCNNGNHVGLGFDFVTDNLLPKYPNIVSVPFQDPNFLANILLIYNPYSVSDKLIRSLGNYIKRLLK